MRRVVGTTASTPVPPRTKPSHRKLPAPVVGEGPGVREKGATPGALSHVAIQLSQPRLIPPLPPATAAASAVATARSALLEAVPAVHRPVAPRLERHFRLLAAVCARGRVHLPGPRRVRAPASGVAAAASARVAAGGLARAPAIRTALRLVRESAARVEFLVIRGERERRSAVNAGQLLVGVWHPTTSCERFLVVRAERCGTASRRT